jgi:acyl-coenzyme A synthetase/AMP-(fatty) acid ligase
VYIDFLIKVFEENIEKDAIVWKDKVYNYRWLLERLHYWQGAITSRNMKQGTVMVLEADFSPNSIVLLLAFIEYGCIITPLTSSILANNPEFIKIAQGEVSFAVDNNDNVKITKLPNSANHKFYQKLRTIKHPGLVLFTSGSTGYPKAAVHDFTRLLEKFKVKRHSLRVINFLLFDHWGGLNTLFYTLSNAGAIITVEDRSADEVCNSIEKYKVDLLPTSPTFLNILLLSEAYKRYDLSSLKMISYGTEPMPLSTLKKLKSIFPTTKFTQTYGLIELGVLRSKSKSDDSLWVKVGGEGFETRIVDGILQIKAQSAMLGYLNAPSPFTEDGWFNTGDSVEVDGEYIRIIGRKSEIINVGGEKVYPAEVENIIQNMENVAEVTIYGEKNPITGNIVCAKVSLLNDENHKEFSIRLKKYCCDRLPNYKVPVKINIVDKKLHSDRLKKARVKS